MAFMQPNVEQIDMWEVSCNHGEMHYVPADLVSKMPGTTELEPYVDGHIDIDDDGDPREMMLVAGKFWARLSAPGYMDCTDWQGPYDTEKEALKDLCETFDIDEEGNDLDY